MREGASKYTLRTRIELLGPENHPFETLIPCTEYKRPIWIPILCPKLCKCVHQNQQVNNVILKPIKCDSFERQKES